MEPTNLKETPVLKMRVSREWLYEIARVTGCVVEIGEPDEEGFYEPMFARLACSEDVRLGRVERDRAA